MTPRPTSTSLVFPSSAEIFQVLQTVTTRFTGLRAGAPADEALPSPGWVVSVVELQGSHSLRISLLAPFELAQSLARAALQLDQVSAEASQDVFHELNNQFVSHLASEHFFPQGASFGPFLPKDSAIVAGSGPKPLADCRALISGLPIHATLSQDA
jgi:hypothetical protein